MPIWHKVSVSKITTSQGTYDRLTGYWNVGTLAPGASATFTVEAVTVSNGSINIEISKTGQAQTDPVPSNNDAAITIKVEKAADIALSSIQAGGPYFVDQQTSFTITATNNGADAATAVAVTQVLPTGLAYVKADPSVGTYDATTCIWTIGDMANLAAATITFTVKPTAAGQLTAQSS